MESFYEERNIKNTNKIFELLEQLPDCCYNFFIGIESNTSTLTRLNYAYDLLTFFNYFISIKSTINKIKDITIEDLETLKSTDFERYLSWLSYYKSGDKIVKNKEKGKARKLSTLRAFFNYLFKHDMIKNTEILKVDMPKIHDKEIVRLEVDEVVKLLNEVDNRVNLVGKQKAFAKSTHKRDLALLSLFLGTGIRISECVGLNLEDFDFNNNAFKVTRKGGNKTILYFSEEVATTLLDYINERKHIKDLPETEKAMFLSLQKKRISIRAVENIVKKYASAAVPLKNISPHKLRSTYGTNLYRETQDIYIVANVLGHKDVNTTRKHYAAISEDMRRNIVDKVKLREN